MPVGYVMGVLPADGSDYRGPVAILPTMSVEPDLTSRNALANARWMALASPAIAEPLAAMLDQVAASAERGEQAGTVDVEDYYQHPLALARLILGATDDD